MASELHQTTRGGEHVLIRPLWLDDASLYADLLGDVSAEDLRLRFFANVDELSAEERHKLAHLDYAHEMAFGAGHGLGWLLMQRLIEYAREKRLRRIYGDVLADNSSMLQMCAELGFHAHDMWSGMKRVVLELEPSAPRPSG